jgi:hypothetical protein
LIGDSYKIGLGLWNLPAVAFGLEAGILIAGLWVYLRASTRASRGGVSGFILFAALMLAVQAMTFFGAPPRSSTGAAVTALAAYAVLAGAAGWLETKRRPVAIAMGA